MKKLLKNTMFVVLILGVMISCNNEDDIPSGQGAVSVKLTDAPFPFDFVTKANVGVTKIELKNAAGDYVVVFEGDSDYNMINLTNGSTKTVATANIKEGKYSKARITLNSASVQLSNGTNFTMNADTQDPYTVVIDPVLEVEAGKGSNVLFDLDINNSYHFKGSWPGNWIPNIANITGCSFDADFRVCDLDKTGEIKGKVTVSDSPEANAYVSVKINGRNITTHTKADGTYRFIGIKEGNYSITCKTNTTGGTTHRNIQVKGTETAVCNINFDGL